MDANVTFHVSRVIQEVVRLLEGDRKDGCLVDRILSCLLAILHGCQIDEAVHSDGTNISLLIRYSKPLSSLPPDQARLVRSAFYWSPSFQTLSDVLLSVMEVGLDGPKALKAHEIMAATPAPITLSCLLSTITCITPSAPSDLKVMSLGADMAASLLNSRFGTGNGVEELVVYLAYKQSGKGLDEWPSDGRLIPPLVGFHHRLHSETIAGQFSSLHEHVPLGRSAQEPTGSWLSLIINGLFDLLGQPESHWSPQSVPSTQILQSALELLGTTIKRACVRGHSSIAARALLSLLSRGAATDSQLRSLMLELVSDSRCLEQIVHGLINSISFNSSVTVPDQPEDCYCLIRGMKDVEIDATSINLFNIILGGNDVLESHSQEMQYCLIDQMLLSTSTMSSVELVFVTSFLASNHCPWPLKDLIKRVSSVWSDNKVLSLTSIVQQGFLTHTLALLLCHFIRKGFCPSSFGHFLPLLLKGVSDRLGGSLVAQRQQAMRIGRLVSFLTLSDRSEPLFEDQARDGNLDWAKEELWVGARRDKPPVSDVSIPGAPSRPTQASPSAILSLKRLDAAVSSAGVDSDDDSEDEGDLPSYNLTESMEIEREMNADPKSLQLRVIASDLQKADDPKLVLKSLARLEALVCCQPEELSLSAPALVRSLLHCRVPEWAEKEAKSKDEDPQMQRLRCLVSLTSRCPVASADTLLSELYSPHIDTFQRLMVLDSLKSAAEEMAGPSVISGSNGARTIATSPGTLQSLEEHPSSAKTRVWGRVALRKKAEPLPATHTNRFASFAMRWATSILRSIDVVSQGVDLLSRDSMVLGRILSTLATFAECASHSSASLPLAVSILEIVKIPQIHQHPDAYIRRAALLATGQVLASLPCASVAQAMIMSDHQLEREKESGAGQKSLIGGLDLSSMVQLRSVDAMMIRGRERASGKWDAQDETLLNVLDFTQSWARRAADDDIDPTCKAMAGACINIQAGLAKQAIDHLAGNRARRDRENILML